MFNSFDDNKNFSEHISPQKTMNGQKTGLLIHLITFDVDRCNVVLSV